MGLEFQERASVHPRSVLRGPGVNPRATSGSCGHFQRELERWAAPRKGSRRLEGADTPSSRGRTEGRYSRCEESLRSQDSGSVRDAAGRLGSKATVRPAEPSVSWLLAHDTPTFAKPCALSSVVQSHSCADKVVTPWKPSLKIKRSTWKNATVATLHKGDKSSQGY